ncbi:PAS domain-containing protein [Pseudidiomarina marina]|uniref:sensor domain-containing diguanylate cyclase n=1 Tax=Pseudidiomarina marina TaxID=502366 RepID=UPI00384E48ED
MRNINNQLDELEAIIDSSGAGTWKWNIQTGETYFNEMWAAIVGYTLDELAPISIATWQRLSHPDDLENSAAQLEQHFSGNAPTYRCDARMRHKNGNWVWVRDTGRVISWSSDGKPEWMVGMHFDITAEKQAEFQARATERKLQRIIDSSPTTIFVWNLDSDELHLYGERVELLHDADDIISNASYWWQNSIHPTDRETMLPKLQEWIRSCSEEPLSRRYRIRGTNGQYYWLKERMRAIIDNGRITQAIGSIINVTDEHKLELELEQKQITLERAQEIGQLGYWTSRIGFDDLFWSNKIYDILGLEPNSVKPSVEAFRNFVHPDDRELFDSNLAAAEATGDYNIEHRIVRADGQLRWVHERASFCKINNEDYIVGTMRDITQSKEYQAQLEELSETDELTRLYNRRYFMSQAKLAYYHLERFDHPSTLVLIDIDHFKKVNDEYGHDVGDLVLQSIANYLKQSLRPSDVVARLGGEEFVLLLHQTELHPSLPRLETLLKGISELEIKTKELLISVTATFGVTEIKRDDTDVSVALIRADQALYEGKRKGRNQVIVNLGKY